MAIYWNEMKWNEIIVYFLLSKKDYFYKWEKVNIVLVEQMV